MVAKRRIVLVLKTLLLLLVVAATAGLVSLHRSGGKLLSVQSGSMAPAINEGDLVSVKRVPYEELAIGDVITFMSQDEKALITHRVVELLPEDPAGNNVVTKGDANDREDVPIEASAVVGKVDRTVPYVGHGLDVLRTWAGLALIIYVPALIVVAAETRRLAQHYKSLYYALPEFLVRRRTPGHAGRNAALVLAGGMIAAFAFALPARALLLNESALTGNTISAAAEAKPKPKPAPPKPKPKPKPKPEPSAPAGYTGGISLRRVFIACEEGESVASSVQIILYNSSRQDIDTSGWEIKSGDDTLLKLPAGTVVQANDTFDTEAPIMDGISYSSWRLTLNNQDDEQIHEHEWHIKTTRECRIRT